MSRLDRIRAAVGQVLIVVGVCLIPESAWVTVEPKSETKDSAITQLYWQN